MFVENGILKGGREMTLMRGYGNNLRNTCRTIAIKFASMKMNTFPSKQLARAIGLYIFWKKSDLIRFQNNCFEDGENSETGHLWE